MAEASRAERGVAVSVQGVNLSFGSNKVLNDVNLEINPGELFTFLGPSGCGKTTLLRFVAGFNKADTGRLLIGGQDVTHLAPWKRDVGMVFQSYALWPHMTVARNVAFGLEERGVPRAEITRRVAAALDLVGMGELGGRRPSELSGGQQQRVALARTIVVEPKVLLLDEPLSNLDARLRVEVRREIRQLQQRLGITAIFVTHDQEEANTISDRIAVMNRGVIAQVGAPIELYEHPANLFVAGFLGTANTLEGRVVGSGADTAYELAGGLSVPLPQAKGRSQAARLVFRPQSVALGAADAAARPGDLRLAGRIVHREFLGATIRYGVAVAAGEILTDVQFRSGEALHEIGAEVAIIVPAEALLILEP